MAESKSGTLGEFLAYGVWAVAAVIAVVSFLLGNIGAVIVTVGAATLLGLAIAGWGSADISEE